MGDWTTEYHQDVGLSVLTRSVLYHAQSDFQTIDIVDTVPYGRMLLLDGAVMTTEKDEFVYHEMISHIPLLAHPHPRRVLIIGGGDGGTVREVLKHPSVEAVVLCEIDGLVVEACKTWLPHIACDLEDPRVTVEIRDGVAYTAAQDNTFDVVIIDSTDPIGPGEGLFTETFYRNVFRALTPEGIMVAQTESPVLDQAVIQKVYPMVQQIFPTVAMYTGHIPTYPSGFWTWAFCSKQHSPQLTETAKIRARTLETGCRYYNHRIHDAAFVLRNFVQALLKQPTGAHVA